MTSNRIEYGKLKETERHNLEDESIRKESNRISEEHYKRADAASALQAKASWENAVTNRINCYVNAAVSFSQIDYNKAATQKILIEKEYIPKNYYLNLRKQELAEKEFQHKQEYDTQMIRIKDRETRVAEVGHQLKYLQYVESKREYNLTYELEKKKTKTTNFKNITEGIKNIKDMVFGKNTGIIQWVEKKTAK